MCAAKSKSKADQRSGATAELARLEEEFARVVRELEKAFAGISEDTSWLAREPRPNKATQLSDTGAGAAEPDHGERFNAIVGMLGGRQVWKRIPTNRFEVHDAIENGISSKALTQLAERITEIPPGKLFDVMGVSKRTMQRKASAPDMPLSQEQGSRLWKFAEILVAATGLMGDQKSAERWLNSPAIALDRRPPVDLMTTQAGTEMVEQLLTRLEYGVYT